MVKKLNEEQFEDIFRKDRDLDRHIPDSHIWERLEDKLELHESKKSKSLYKFWAIAASFLVVIGAAFVFSFYFTNNTVKGFSTNGTHSLIYMEDLGSESVHYAELSNIDLLNAAYASIGENK